MNFSTQMNQISKIIFKISTEKFNPIDFKAKTMKLPETLFKSTKFNSNGKINFEKILTLLNYILILYLVSSPLTVKCEKEE